MDEHNEASDLFGIVAFTRAAEGLKTTMRSGWTSAGRPESVAEHSWRVCLLAVVLQSRLPPLDFPRLIKMCIIHDLAEVIGGDIPAPEQRASATGKAADERRDLEQLLAPLPEPLREEVAGLWDEYTEAATPEARVAKGLDKLETILQHTQGDNPEDFDYRFNLGYGRAFTSEISVLADLRAILDRETELRARAVEDRAGEAS